MLVRVPLKFLFQHFKSADNIVMTETLSVQEANSLYIENCFSDIIMLIGIAPQTRPGLALFLVKILRPKMWREKEKRAVQAKWCLR